MITFLPVSKLLLYEADGALGGHQCGMLFFTYYVALIKHFHSRWLRIL